MRTPKPSGRMGELRQDRSYARRPGNRSQRLMLIVCEGKETEPNYFNALRRSYRLSRVRVEVVPGTESDSSPKRALALARQKHDELELDISAGDEVWCVFDTEQPGTYGNLPDLLTEAQRSGIRTVVSCPAFEYWYLLHYERTDRPFANAAELSAYLRRRLPDYDKNIDAYARLGERTAQAVENARFLAERARDAWDRPANPSTTVYRLVSRILQADESA